MLVNPRERYCKQLGFDEGISKGEENGKLEVARKMLNDGFSIDKVVELTGLSKQDILNVKQSGFDCFFDVVYANMLEEEEYNLYVEANTMLVNPRERYCKQLGFDEGKIEGEIEGFKEGISKGVENGKLEVARRMLNDGFSIGKVVELTGLSMENILNVE